MNHTFDSPDREHFNDLLDEFSVDNPPEIEKALALIHSRYSCLSADRFTDHLSNLDDRSFEIVFHKLPLSLHKYLFQDIFCNAGYYRQQTDRNHGLVYFGANQKFKGFSPGDIEDGIVKACSNLSKSDECPLYSVAKFYQQFVLVHPFYDANGRIGRLITDI